MRASLPFVAGFATVFVLLGVGAVAIGLSARDPGLRRIAGFILIVFGFSFMGLLPLPQRLLGAGLLQRARRRGSSFLGAAFAICAAPCIGAVLASILVLAGDSGAVCGADAARDLLAGMAIAFLIAGLAFMRAMASSAGCVTTTS